MSRRRVVVLGGNFGGLTAALAVCHELHGDVDVTMARPGSLATSTAEAWRCGEPD